MNGPVNFYPGLARHIEARLPDRDVVAAQLARLMSRERSQAWERKPEGPESAFIGEYVLPSVEEFLRRTLNLTITVTRFDKSVTSRTSRKN